MSHIVGSVNINWFNLRIMGNVLGIIVTFLENYQGFFENLRIYYSIIGKKLA